MRVLHVTDTHLGIVRVVRRPGDPHPRRDLLQRDAERALRAALRPALHGEVDAVVHTGDLFDRSRPPASAVRFAADLLGGLAQRMPVVVMAGNHDRRGLLRYLPLRRPMLHVVDRPTRLCLGPLTLGVVPFERTAAGFSVAAAVATGPGVDALLTHQAFDGQRVPIAFEGTSPSRWFTFRPGRAGTVGAEHLPRGVGWVLGGHVHPRQVVTVGEATVVCPGSTVRTSFAERAQAKGYARWSFDREVRWSFHDVPSRPLRELTTAADLDQVQPGDLCRWRGAAVTEAAVAARGGWWLPRPARPDAPRSPPSAQLSWLSPR